MQQTERSNHGYEPLNISSRVDWDGVRRIVGLQERDITVQSRPVDVLPHVSRAYLEKRTNLQPGCAR